MCHKVSMMSGSENHRSFVTVDDYVMMALQILSPKAAILLEKVLGIVQKCGICSVGESWGMFRSTEPLTNTVQMLIGSPGSIGSGE